MTNAARWMAVAGLLTLLPATAQEAGRITAVRVYRGQALVSRRIDFTATAGGQDLTVTGLPQQVIPNSMYATGDGKVVIRAVRYRAEAVSEEPREDVRQLDQKLADLESKVARNEALGLVIEKQLAYLDKLENFVAPTASAELSKGVLDAEQLIAMTRFSLEQRGELTEKQLENQAEAKQLEAEGEVLLRQRQALAGGGASSVREAVVFLEAREGGPATVELNYMVGAVSWGPAYIARLDAAGKLLLEYHAIVSQLSGEDWNNVALTLSTGSRAMQADAPVLAPLWVGLSSGELDDKPVDAKDYANQRAELEEQLRGGPAQRQAAGGEMGGGMAAAPGRSGGDGPSLGAALPTGPGYDQVSSNMTAAKLQQLELAASDEAIAGARREAGGASEGLAVDYPLPGQVSVRSRSDQQMFRIAAAELQATLAYTSVPLLSDFVYLSAEARNTSGQALLAGAYSAYKEGAFAGEGNLPMTADGQNLTIGFGTESRLKVTRELVDKKTEIRGGNKQLTYTYRFRLSNFMTRDAVVQLWDRLPQTPNDQVAITLIESGRPLSEDALYVQHEKSRGLLRWDVPIPAGTSGAEAISFDYQFRLEFDKNYDIGALPAELEAMIANDLRARVEMKGMAR